MNKEKLCPKCSSKISVIEFTRSHSDGDGPELVYGCSDLECESHDKEEYSVSRSFISLPEKRSHYEMMKDRFMLSTLNID